MKSRRIILPLMVLLSCQSAHAADQQRMKDLGTCLAFSYVNAGLDGKKDVPEDLLPGIMAIKDEYMFEATVNGLDDNAAQTFVVEQLAEQNRMSQEKGVDTVRAMYRPLCSDVAETLMGRTRQSQ